MPFYKKYGFCLAGGAAGAISGLFGAGGGMLLVPLLVLLTDLPEEEIFGASVSIILPICLVSLAMTPALPPLHEVLPYLLGSFAGGLLATRINIPTLWLHRGLGLLILWGGFRYLCP